MVAISSPPCESQIRATMHNLSRSNWRTRQAAELHTVIARINLEHAPLRDYLCRIDSDEVHCCCGEFFATFTHHAQHLADVVIAESGLRQAMRSPAPAGPVETRWVTEWVAAS
jgi:hypothetical protein